MRTVLEPWYESYTRFTHGTKGSMHFMGAYWQTLGFWPLQETIATAEGKIPQVSAAIEEAKSEKAQAEADLKVARADYTQSTEGRFRKCRIKSHQILILS
eukprot:1817309-Amphidinium_carterae.1